MFRLLYSGDPICFFAVNLARVIARFTIHFSSDLQKTLTIFVAGSTHSRANCAPSQPKSWHFCAVFSGAMRAFSSRFWLGFGSEFGRFLTR
jgi:hypothetical protein